MEVGYGICVAWRALPGDWMQRTCQAGFVACLHVLPTSLAPTKRTNQRRRTTAAPRLAPSPAAPRAQVGALNRLEGVSCNAAEGALYAFPRVTLPEAAVAAAKKLGAWAGGRAGVGYVGTGGGGGDVCVVAAFAPRPPDHQRRTYHLRLSPPLPLSLRPLPGSNPLLRPCRASCALPTGRPALHTL